MGVRYWRTWIRGDFPGGEEEGEVYECTCFPVFVCGLSTVLAGGGESSDRERVQVMAICTSFGLEKRGKEVRF